jgi:Ras-related protein Rab-5C
MCCNEKEKPGPNKGIKPPKQTNGLKKDIKIVLLGDKAVGKSSIASRFCFDKVI